ncbi:hypothetical protein [Calothrix sp. PCC 7507]|uniref:hypothetical protein n=1 Tax=Calothrix sp. PCC 7507 TaxID=99598 RepID=UPI00029F1192|nr:hypothetical protein [Calothrix sp. PCC 7507]AFY34883.1 hypothetical protein Cal7507_4514 [Calothrix sp. PCC 7507]
MNQSHYLFDLQQVELFKNWIRRRFIAEVDFRDMPVTVALAWSAALKELSESVSHEIVPFRRGSKS